MAILSVADAADLLAEFTDAQPDHSLVLRRIATDGTKTTIPAQSVQVAYAQRQPDTGGQPATAQSLSGVTFYRESPFNVQTGDRFTLDGHKGGTILRVYPDPVIGVIIADGSVDMGA